MQTERYPILDQSSLDYAREHLNETSEKRIDYLRKLREHFADNESESIRITTDEDILLGFLRGCKYDLPRSIKKIRSYYKLRTNQPKLFADRDPRSQRIQDILHCGICLPLRKLQNNSLVLLLRATAYDPSKFTVEEVVKAMYLNIDMCSKICPQMQIHGFITIIDLEGFSLAQMRQVTPGIIWSTVRSWETYYCSPKLFLFINMPTIFEAILRLLKVLMSKKLRERVFAFRGGYEELVDLMDLEILPVECGGKDGYVEDHTLFWVKTITDHADWFIFDEQFKML